MTSGNVYFQFLQSCLPYHLLQQGVLPSSIGLLPRLRPWDTPRNLWWKLPRVFLMRGGGGGYHPHLRAKYQGGLYHCQIEMPWCLRVHKLPNQEQKSCTIFMDDDHAMEITIKQHADDCSNWDVHDITPTSYVFLMNFHMKIRRAFIMRKRGNNWHFIKVWTYGEMGDMVTSERILPVRLGCIIMFLLCMRLICYLDWITKTLPRGECWGKWEV